MSFASYSYSLLKPIIKKYYFYFKDLEGDLRKGGIAYTGKEYFSMTLMSTIISFISSIFLVSFFSLLFTNNLVFSLLLGGIVSILASLGVFVIFFTYPSQVVATKRKKIENSLYYAVVYMSTLAGTGVPPFLIFQMISKFKELGEVSDISDRICADVKMFGLDITEALSRAGEKAPSESLREILFGMKSTLTSGGNLKGYLVEKSKRLLMEQRRRLQEYVKVLSIFMELYITIVVVGSVFIIVLTTIMSLMGGYVQQIQVVQMVLITVGLPFLSAAFILLLKTISPSVT